MYGLLVYLLNFKMWLVILSLVGCKISFEEIYVKENLL